MLTSRYLRFIAGLGALACYGATAEAAPVAELVLPAAPRGKAAEPGSIRFIGAAAVLVSYRGIQVLVDPTDADERDLPAADLIVLPALSGEQAGALSERLDRRTAIVATPQAVALLRQFGFRRLYPLQLWQVMLVSKGATSLRLTSMPGGIGAQLPEVLDVVLDFGGKGRRPYRLLAGGSAGDPAGVAALMQRFPGVDLALLPHVDGRRAVLMDGVARKPTLLPDGQPYFFP